ncbi:MAG: histidinol-phosphate transaminase [Clostridia bacterium]|nr:histidinol-phosphate transaminase [Clostridia bacterium]
MSRFFSNKYSTLEAYTPGEQPKDMKYIKLNTNESPFSPSESVIKAVMGEATRLQLYSDPECTPLVAKCAELYGVSTAEVLMTNGSDEILNFAFMAFCDDKRPIVFPEITYGFYPVFAELNHIPYEQIPLRDDFTIDVNDYIGINKNIVIANPNAPTGTSLSLCDIEKIVSSNPDNVVIIDEAYVDFGAQSAVSLIHKYDNLIVTQTFSKSRSLAGARLGYGIACEALINDMNTIKYSTNPYNVNRMTMIAGYNALCDNDYYMDNCKTIIKNREYTKKSLEALGFSVLDSSANFLFAKSDKIGGEALYLALKKNGILVRHFSKEKIKDFNRITIGTREQMEALISTIEKILKEL